MIIWSDERTLVMDGTVLFGKGYDFFGLECLSQQTETCRGSFIVWPESRDYRGERKWSVYGGDLGWLMVGEFDTEEDAKQWVVDYHESCLEEMNENQ